MRDLIIIRHGESERNVSNHHLRQGNPAHAILLEETCHAHTRLTPNGVSEAVNIGKFLNCEIPQLEHGGNIHYLCSDMVRARETAGNLNIRNALWECTSLLREVSWGETEHCVDPQQVLLDMHRQHIDDISSWSSATGEMFTSTYIRALSFMDYANTLQGTVVAVSHGQFMKVLDMLICNHTAVQVSHPMKDVGFMHNCGVAHYMKEPNCNEQTSEFSHVRTTSRNDPCNFVKMHKIARERHTCEQLLAECEKYPRYL